MVAIVRIVILFENICMNDILNFFFMHLKQYRDSKEKHEKRQKFGK